MGGIFAKLERQLLASMSFSFSVITHGVLGLHTHTCTRSWYLIPPFACFGGAHSQSKRARLPLRRPLMCMNFAHCVCGKSIEGCVSLLCSCRGVCSFSLLVTEGGKVCWSLHSAPKHKPLPGDTRCLCTGSLLQFARTRTVY
jgi:hypothetical protein